MSGCECKPGRAQRSSDGVSVPLSLINSALFMIGTKLAHYEITSHLGTGGMGEVYQATDGRLGRSVAIKLLPEAFMHNRDSAERFEREARVLGHCSASLRRGRFCSVK